MENIDFTGIMNIGKAEGKEQPKPQPNQGADLNKRAVNDLERKQRLLEEAKNVYKEYQANIKMTEELRVDILKTTNKDPRITKDLFMKAIKIVSLLCHEPTFYDQIEKRVVE